MPCSSFLEGWGDMDLITVGMSASLTGQFSGQGIQALAGAKAWVRDCNSVGGVYVASAGRKLPIRLVHYDDQSVAGLAGALTERLISEDRVDLLLGPYSSVLTLAAAPVAEKHHRVLWNHGGASDGIHEQGYRWTVSILTPASTYLHGVVDLVREMDPEAHKVVILYSARGSFPNAVASGVEAYALNKGFQIVYKARYRPPLDDFSPWLDEMAAEEPDVVIGVGRIQDDLALAKQIVERRFEVRAIAVVAAGIGQFQDELGVQATGFMGPSQWEPGVDYSPDYGPSAGDLARRHDMFGPGGGDYAMAQAYAGGLVAQRCVEESGRLDNAALREVAARLDFTTFYGRFKLDADMGLQVGRSVVIVQWQGGRKVVVWPRELRQTAPIYPFPYVP